MYSLYGEEQIIIILYIIFIFMMLMMCFELYKNDEMSPLQHFRDSTIFKPAACG